jgi:hypothetical protein
MEEPRTTSTHPGVVANGVGYDPSEVNSPGVAVFTLVLIGLILAVFFGVTLYYEKFSTEMVHDRVDASPAADLAAIRAREATDLTSYQMLDKSKGVVRIPIEQAMKALLTEVPAGKAYSTKDQIIKVEPAPGAAVPAVPGAPAVVAPAPVAAAAPAHK